MACAKKPRLDIHQSSVDIISELIDKHLEHIARDILTNLSQKDMANAVVANPKWAEVATSRTQLKRLISRNKENTAPFKAICQREELIAQQMETSMDTSSIFLKACTRYSSLGKSQLNPTEKKADFYLVSPMECPFPWLCSSIYVTQDLIATVLNDVPDDGYSRGNAEHYNHFVQVYDRWTFQLLNSITLQCRYSHLCFVENNIQAALISCSFKKEGKVSLWDLTTGELHAFPGPSPSVYQSFCVDKLIVLLWNDGEELFATIFKLQPETESTFVCIADREPLHCQVFDWKVPSAEGLDCFAICAIIYKPSRNSIFQVRSKEDFTLLRTVEGLVPDLSDEHNAFLLTECFALVFNEKVFHESSIDVVWLGSDAFKAVHRFFVPDELLSPIGITGSIAIVGNYLVLYCELAGYDAAIWKLPSNFVETCYRHLKEGTVGTNGNHMDCDQIIDEECTTDPMLETPEFRYHVDRYGILKSRIDGRTPVLHLTMLDCIISELGD